VLFQVPPQRTRHAPIATKLAAPQSARFEFTTNPLTFAPGSTQAGPPHESVCWGLYRSRLHPKQVGEKLCKRLAGHTCAAMKGLHEEGSEWIGEDAETEVMDAGIIAAAQRVENYEMAGYGTVQTLAKLLGEKRSSRTFTLRLNEEKAADKKLSSLQNRSMLKQRLKGLLQACKRQNRHERIGEASCTKSLLAGNVRSGTSGVIWRRN
jgi:Domain of unknown function (DUF892)